MPCLGKDKKSPGAVLVSYITSLTWTVFWRQTKLILSKQTAFKPLLKINLETNNMRVQRTAISSGSSGEVCMNIVVHNA
jgi:hypothetical protein